ncbi:N(4)-acetylcytidine aminohydrolase [Vibrio sp. SCSIO 43136]|uniref:N(4)-acetylcytidine aminohydrolase n=1 Tax=Vibrio sp. SCSIO 43136 TaxID=2819101 RepID=UPI0020751D1C|nr:N(4)-acetylcytidine aminohydrolase [Vibrio sp. SCSIO 43136]USD66670.1 ASCH domain-containing protein [Vibrio sp. SCSIO 43136]
MTFFERFESDILSGKKTITIRDAAEKDYAPGSVVQVSAFEDGRWFCALQIVSVTPVLFEQLSDFHATQENMTLEQLQLVIREIYPNTDELYVIEYQLVS